ncbi:DUF4374 domain-containing protein [Pedobacter panaciterrae]|uniref:DUF4374 domain-containing protein n=1 Tax=Pedobacter panaciterrae TaxID=363849 RepID=UPI00155DB885|nr:DUF4374 domain-containing protein [Pedobacter panaciterrae]NQX52230.1 DUF4374 domain-containing protein [Pedobacter panaciterrae]
MQEKTIYKSVKKVILLLTSATLSLFLYSCSQQPETSNMLAGKNYSMYILGKDGKEYIVETNSLDSGKILPEQQGAMLDAKAMDRDIIVKDGSYYHLNRKKAELSKYNVQNDSLHTVASIPLKDFSIENYLWVGKDSLLLTGLDIKGFKQAKYVLIETGKMDLLSSGSLAIPQPSGKLTSMSIGFVELRKNHLFVGYTYHQQLSSSNYTTSDTTYIAELGYPQMNLLKIDKDTRSTYPGGINTVQSYSFNDEHNNYYFMSCPGIALGNRPALPSGIFRIKAGDESLDKDYFINISSSLINNHAYGMWYIGNNKAIIRSERKDLFKGLGDHYSTAHFEFYLIDLAAARVIKKLNLPLDKGTRRECIIVKDNMAYIAVNSSTQGNFIWIYNPKTDDLKKGLELAGNTDFIMRIDKLNP